jgi:hypothetical protein
MWNYPRQHLEHGHRIEKSVAAANCFELQKAKDDNSFSRSLDAVKDAFPSSLKIMGNHNPLSILPACLSDGAHNLSDEECLKFGPEGSRRTCRTDRTDCARDGVGNSASVPQSLHLSTGDFISEKEISGFLDTVAKFEHFGGRKVMNPAPSGDRVDPSISVIGT